MKEGFVRTKLGVVGKVRMCKRVLKEQTSPKGDVPFYKIATFGNQPDVYIPRELFEEYKRKFSFPRKGEVLISAAGTIGKTVVFNGEDAYFQDSNIVWIDNDESKILNSYLYYFYQLKPWVSTNGSTILRLYNENLRELDIYHPVSLNYQQSIVSVLNVLDSKIELNNKVNAELEALAKLIYDYWFVQFDFPNAEGKPYKSSGGKMVWNEELKREIPEGWEVKSIEVLLVNSKDNSRKISSKDILPDGKYPVVSQDAGPLISGYTNEDNPISELPLIVFGDHSCTLRYIDFPFFRGADGTQVMRLPQNMTYYIYKFLESVVTQIPNYGKYERHYKYIKNLLVVVPPKDLLIRFHSLLQRSLELLRTLTVENYELATLRDWLLPMLMNGQVTVKD